ncbi:hypothetical protein AOQ84DRAFT_306174, partial [Glonium stellatum]
DLWSAALQKLSVEDQRVIECIAPTQANGIPFSERVEELIEITRNKQDECEKKRYKFSFRGHEIILRDVAEKIIIWLDKFKAIGDVAVNFDPVHSSLPWAGVRFLLQVSVGEQEQMGSLLVTAEKFTYLINRCTIYDLLYGSTTTPGKELQNLHAALVELYVTILQLIALAYRLYTKSTTARAVHSFLNPEGVSGILSKCQNIEARVECEAQNCERMRSRVVGANFEKSIQTLQQLHDAMQKPILRTDERVLVVLQNMGQRERQEILEWISRIPYGMNHDMVKEKRTANTCQWLLGHKNYREWQDTSSSTILWLHGSPGAGKTYLTSTVIDDISKILQSGPNHEGFAFFYCNRNESQRRDPLSVLRSFVRQLSNKANDENSVQNDLYSLYKKLQSKATELTLTRCKELISCFVNLYPKTTLVLDALDECDRSNRNFLVQIFEDLLSNAERPVKIFISSRPDGDIRERFKTRANIEIQATDNQEDIATFVKSEIINHQRWSRISPKLQIKIVETLLMRSQGMFQWAALQIRQLLELDLEDAIEDRLGKLPMDLKHAYDEIYGKIKRNEKQREIADRAFQWVMASCEPLQTPVFLEAVLQDVNNDTARSVRKVDEDLVLQLCQNLLVIDSELKVWRFSHLSVAEYFEQHHWTRIDANCFLAKVCLVALLSDDTEVELEMGSDETRNKSRSLAHYARHHWMIHVKNHEGESPDHRLSNLLERLLGSPYTDSSCAYQRLHRVVMKEQYRSKPSTSFFSNSDSSLYNVEQFSAPSFAICIFGFYTTLPNIWAKPWPNLSQVNNRSNSLLSLAASAGYVSICQRLVKWGVEVDMWLQYGDFGSALSAAVSQGHKDVTQLLIKSGADSGADVNMQLQNGRYGSALVAASHYGKKMIVGLLIESGAEVNMQHQNGQYASALVAASSSGYEGVAQLLIKSGASLCNDGV